MKRRPLRLIGKTEDPEKPVIPLQQRKPNHLNRKRRQGRTISSDTRSQIENAINLLEQGAVLWSSSKRSGSPGFRGEGCRRWRHPEAKVE